VVSKVTSVQSAVTQAHTHHHFAVHLLPCQQYIVPSQLRLPLFQMCKIATVVMEITQLVLIQF